MADTDPAGDDDAADARDRRSLRVDRWLWCARFYRSRALAGEAVSGGHVHVNGARAKPSRALRVGDLVGISLRGREIELHVRAIPSRRGPAAEARGCYEETPQSLARAARLRELHRLAALAAPRPAGRPDKKSRRELIELGRRQGGD